MWDGRLATMINREQSLRMYICGLLTCCRQLMMASRDVSARGLCCSEVMARLGRTGIHPDDLTTLIID